jgi:hypothetical protein
MKMKNVLEGPERPGAAVRRTSPTPRDRLVIFPLPSLRWGEPRVELWKRRAFFFFVLLRKKKGNERRAAMAKRLLPSLNRVLVEKLVQPKKTAGGILLPETSKQVAAPSPAKR